ncbi:glycoside hydrolase family 3 N-terminal domain-containing protein [uncultured Clostridium sp.]|uniref:glycoside hydrolase family 3 N-terminal domain-containing protein n=1 Tax=uncultured Clostridium sp. TaxID=59620 RepID=UPI0025836DF6|nr:glycoside hydrolase family 3 N-terminal domain-containing protein [uncultured Clostridium sp.]
MRRMIYFLVISIFLLTTSGCSVYKAENHKEPSGSNKNDIIDNKKEKELSEEEILNKKVKDMMTDMTLEQKIGQLFIVNLEDVNNGLATTVFTEDIKKNINKYNVGGIILFQNNIKDREQLKLLTNNIQNNSNIPLFISVDEEGGIVSRLSDIPSMKVTKFENMADIGEKEDYNRAYIVGDTIGKEINELDFNLDFALVADVITNPNNTEIGRRSFGSDPEIVANMVKEVVKGLQENNVSATLKHFPGHGGSEENSHNEFSYTPQTLEGMRKTEFLPFISGIEEDVDFIMISHISAPNVTGDNTPSSLSKTIITDLLRKELGYENIVTTDALNMKAISNYYSPKDAAIKAINAGADVLLMTPDFKNVYDHVLESVQNGTISEERINESVERILKVKIKRNIVSNDKTFSKNEGAKVDSGNSLKEENSQKTLIDNITQLARQGKIINSDFSVKVTTIQDIEESLGKADTSNFVSEAKGIYYTFSKDNVAFGCNKGDQAFEARSFDSKLGELSIYAVKKVLGEPAYSSKYDNEQIIGYTAGNEYKILFVFKQSKDSENDLVLDHYSVLYPKGTVNNMSGDPGREW